MLKEVNMKKVFLWTGCLVASLALVACGDSSDNSESNIDFDEDLSSSEESSSAEAESSSSIDLGLPDGIRAATLEDLEKNYVIEVNKAPLHMATGVKQGLFSFWVVGNAGAQDTGKALVVSDFENGFINVGPDNMAVSTIKVENDKFILNQLQAGKLKFQLQFGVNEDDSLVYAVDGGKFKVAEVEKLAVDKSVVTNAENLEGKRIACKEGDTTVVYSFLKGRYFMERVVGSDTISWNAGYADAHRGTVLMKMQFRSGADYPMWSKVIASDFSSMNGVDCKVSDFTVPKAVETSSIAGEWTALDSESNINWTWNLKNSMEYELLGNKGADEQKLGSWDVYGDVLLMSVNTMLDADTRCKNGCPAAIKGNVKDLKKGSSFTYNHSDVSDPMIPTKWEVPEYE